MLTTSTVTMVMPSYSGALCVFILRITLNLIFTRSLRYCFVMSIVDRTAPYAAMIKVMISDLVMAGLYALRNRLGKEQGGWSILLRMPWEHFLRRCVHGGSHTTRTKVLNSKNL